MEPTDENYAFCRELFHNNYKLALDDFVYQPEWDRFLKLVRLIKFDVKQTPFEEILPVVKKLKKHKKIKLLAEKLETADDFEKAYEMGFDFFQGYFFAKTNHDPTA